MVPVGTTTLSCLGLSGVPVWVAVAVCGGTTRVLPRKPLLGKCRLEVEELEDEEQPGAGSGTEGVEALT
jgi:hypothetical protein